jgi:DNA repair photolyase
LNPTSGFLSGGYTHTINLSLGCAFAHSLCGIYCYVKHNYWITKGRPWGLYGFKKNIRDAYRRDYDQVKRAGRGGPNPLRVFMSSSSDPYAPQESRLRLTQAILEEMLRRPPDVLVIQSRSPLITRDLALILELSRKCEVWVSVTVETDRDRIPGFPNHATPFRKRVAALRTFRDAGVATQATVSPLLPLLDANSFASSLGAACDRVILDHYLLGDGSPGGTRTKRTALPRLLEEAGFGIWNTLEKFWEVKTVFDGVLGPRRVSVSCEGFNAVGPRRSCERNDDLGSS